MNNPNNISLTATEWSRQYVQEWLRAGETELWAGQSTRLKGTPVITVVHCAGFDGEPPCIEVRIGKRVHASTMATRNWQHERRAAVRVGMELAGKRGNVAEIDAALDAVKARQPSVTQHVAELAGLIADRLAYENGSWELAECIDVAKGMAWTVSSQGPHALRAALDAERMGKNGRETEHEVEARETERFDADKLKGLIADLVAAGGRDAEIAALIATCRKKRVRSGYLLIQEIP